MQKAHINKLKNTFKKGWITYKFNENKNVNHWRYHYFSSDS